MDPDQETRIHAGTRTLGLCRIWYMNPNIESDLVWISKKKKIKSNEKI